MAKLLRVLFVDDSVYDCMLLVKELRSGGFNPRYSRVDSAETLTAALAQGPWDIVAVDYGMPQLSTVSVIESVRKHDPELPVIVISDVAGDDGAVATLTAGAKDFILRDKIDRFVPGVNRQLTELEQRRNLARTRSEARRAEERLRSLAEASSEILTVLAPDGTIRYGTPSVERGLGYDPTELAGTDARTLIHPDDAAAFQRLLDEVNRAPGDLVSTELHLRHKNGSWRTLDCVAKNLLDDPSVAGILLDARDVTDRRRADNPLARADTRDRTPSASTETRIGPIAGRGMGGPRAQFEKLGRYRVMQLIGEGGMGSVYKAHDPKLDRLIAIKVPRFDVPRSDLTVVVQRFLREARSAAQVRHPNVCPIYDVDEHEGMPFVVMAFVDGESMAEHLRVRPSNTDPADTVRLIRQIAVGLRAVHSHGIVHRDLKPANILIDREGQALLTDFGLARPDNESQRLTMHGAVIGTPGYMAPEQAAGESDRIGPWTDLYSLGVMMYVTLTGQLPYQGSVLTVLIKQLEQPPPPPTSLRADIDAPLESLVLKAMARRPEDRFQSVQQFIDAVDGWLSTGPSRPAATGAYQPGKSQGSA